MSRTFKKKDENVVAEAPQKIIAPPPGVPRPTSPTSQPFHGVPGLPQGLMGHQFKGSPMTGNSTLLAQNRGPINATSGGLPAQSVGGTEKAAKNSGPPVPGEGLPRAINYYADYGGCGLWRMIWPSMMLNGYSKAVMNDLTMMLPIEHFYEGAGAVRIQRQASVDQRSFAHFLATSQQKHGFNLIYEVDDVIFGEDIPDYNRCKDAFVDPKLKDNIKYIIGLCNKFSVVSPYMREYYINKLSLDPDMVKVVPNYPPRFWLDNYYNHENKMEQYDQNKKRPRIGYCGSGTHFDVANRTGYNDDFSHVSEYVLATLKEYQWVFLGGIPPALRRYQEDGTIEVFPWCPIYEFPRTMASLNLQAVVAPLADNEFNRAKSNIKVLESGALGIPGTFQDIPCYSDIGPSLFTTGEEMLMNIGKILQDEDSYSAAVKQARAIAEENWLEDHLGEYEALYFDKRG